MNRFKLEILEADGYFYRGESDNLVVPLEDGEAGIQALHENQVMSIVPGILHFTDEDGEVRYASIGPGMVRIEDGDVLVLVETAERPEEIDINRARRNEQKAREELEHEESMRQYRLAELSLEREIARIKLWNRTKTGLDPEQ